MTAASAARKYRYRLQGRGNFREDIELDRPLWEGHKADGRRPIVAGDERLPALAERVQVGLGRGARAGRAETPGPAVRRAAGRARSCSLRRAEREGVLSHRPGGRLNVGPRFYRVAAVEEGGGLVLVEPD